VLKTPVSHPKTESETEQQQQQMIRAEGQLATITAAAPAASRSGLNRKKASCLYSPQERKAWETTATGRT
jgi:hypothetical protein